MDYRSRYQLIRRGQVAALERVVQAVLPPGLITWTYCIGSYRYRSYLMAHITLPSASLQHEPETLGTLNWLAQHRVKAASDVPCTE